MIFNSLTFVVFFLIVLGFWRLRLPWTARKTGLLLASYAFYAAWNPPFVILLWVSTVVDWWAAQAMVKSERKSVRHGWMLASVIVNLGMLSYFKYGKFLLDNFVLLAGTLGIAYKPPAFSIVLPVGISFYTFATLSYTLDVYLRRAKPAKSFLDYALFVTFFPHLVAGPIMRPTELVPQFAEPKRASGQMLCFGLGLITLGLFNKVVLADGFLAPAVEAVFDHHGAGPLPVPLMLDAWVATLAFAGQIFCDFAGYSTTAIGVAMCLGFAMPDNFRFPYAALGFSDFWKRWHITLSSWLRDYLYIPLGGSRHGPLRTFGALMTTMLLGGLWHGANWTFVVWGALHGLYLSADHFIRARWRGKVTLGPAAKAGVIVLTFLLVDIAWVFFRADSFGTAWTILAALFGHAPSGAPKIAWIPMGCALAVVSGILVTHWRMRATTLEAVVQRTPVWLLGTIWTAMAFAVIIEQGKGNAFIYFAF